MPENPETASVSFWPKRLDSDSECSRAQLELWNRYFARLADLAQSRLPANVRQESDGEDVATSALASFFHRHEKGQFPDLRDRTGLWPLLAQIAVFKALRNIRRERAKKRGGNRVVSERELEATADGSVPTLDELIADDPTPELIAEMNEQARRLLELLPADPLKVIATRKLEGYRNDEIAEELKVGVRTVERKLALIRSVWSSENSP